MNTLLHNKYVRPYNYPVFASTFHPYPPLFLLDSNERMVATNGVKWYRKDDFLTYQEALARYMRLNESGINVLNSNLIINGIARTTTTPSWCMQKVGQAPQNAVTIVSYNQHICPPIGVTTNFAAGSVKVDVAGYYQIYFHNFSDDITNNICEIDLMLNNFPFPNRIRNYTNKLTSIRHFNGVDLLCVVYLNVNDFILIRLNAGSAHGNFNAVFSGYLLGI